jgi:hypothetical protein
MSIDGTWEVSISTPMGEQKATVTLSADGNKLKGKMESAMVSKDFEGTVDGNNLAWEIDITNPMPMTLKITTTVNGDAVSGQVGLGMFGSAPLTGHRV